jgi:hypothetical protein
MQKAHLVARVHCGEDDGETWDGVDGRNDRPKPIRVDPCDPTDGASRLAATLQPTPAAAEGPPFQTRPAAGLHPSGAEPPVDGRTKETIDKSPELHLNVLRNPVPAL